MILDLVDQMLWEDVIVFESLEDAGLENGFDSDTVPGAQQEYYQDEDKMDYLAWFLMEPGPDFS